MNIVLVVIALAFLPAALFVLLNIIGAAVVVPVALVEGTRKAAAQKAANTMSCVKCNGPENTFNHNWKITHAYSWACEYCRKPRTAELWRHRKEFSNLCPA